MLEGLVLVVCHETLYYHFVGLDVHIRPSVGQCGCTALYWYARPFAIVDGQFSLVVRQRLAICQNLHKSRLASGHHAIGEKLGGKVEVVRPRLIDGTVQGQVAEGGVPLYLRTEIFVGIARIHTYATRQLGMKGHCLQHEQAKKEQRKGGTATGG